MSAAPIDYDALAQKHGAQPAIDYDALARQHGAAGTQAVKPTAPPESGMLDKADTAITSALAPNPKNLRPDAPGIGPGGIIDPIVKEYPKALGRELYNGVKTLGGMLNPRPYYHALTDTPQPDEPLLPSMYDPSGRIALGVHRLAVKPVMNAVEDYSSGKVSLDDVLANAPEALGAGAGTVVGGKLMAEASPIVRSVLRKPIPTAAATRGALAQKIVGPLTYENVGETAGDVRTGANPERGLVNEGLVGTKKGLVAKADARLGELKQAANNILENHPNAKAIINAEPMVDEAIDNAIAQAKKSGTPTERLEGVRQALKTQYGKLQGTPREMNELKSQIQDQAQNLGAYKNTQPVEASVARALSEAARKIKDAVNEKVPEAAELNQRMQDLADARSGIQKKVNQARGEDIFSKTASNTAGTAGKILQRTLGSAPVRTGIARVLNAGNVKPVPEPMAPSISAPAPIAARPVVQPAGRAIPVPSAALERVPAQQFGEPEAEQIMRRPEQPRAIPMLENAVPPEQRASTLLQQEEAAKLAQKMERRGAAKQKLEKEK
jgi:hypothetical protein